MSSWTHTKNAFNDLSITNLEFIYLKINSNFVGQDNHRILPVVDFQSVIVVVRLHDSLNWIVAFSALPKD